MTTQDAGERRPPASDPYGHLRTKPLTAYETAIFVRRLAEQSCDPTFANCVTRIPTGAKDYRITPRTSDTTANVVENPYTFRNGRQVSSWRVTIYRHGAHQPYWHTVSFATPEEAVAAAVRWFTDERTPEEKSRGQWPNQ